MNKEEREFMMRLAKDMENLRTRFEEKGKRTMFSVRCLAFSSSQLVPVRSRRSVIERSVAPAFEAELQTTAYSIRQG